MRYYHNLLGTTPVHSANDLDSLSKAFQLRLTGAQQLVLAREVTYEEIIETLFSLKSNKAPGLDGLFAYFFKKAWSIVGELVLRAVKSFVESGRLLREVNSTAISLIPKVPNPTLLKDFRPISCCNTIVKCIAKIPANRMKIVLRVGKFQTAFVKGRRIGDNILLAQELFRNYHRDKGSPRCAIKVDLKKAYDTVQWDFINNVLKIVIMF